MSDSALRVNDRYLAPARALSRGASTLVMLAGALALAGWMFDIAILKSFSDGTGITMKANTAASLLLSGASLWLLRGGRSTARYHRAGEALALLVGAIGIATLGQHLFGWNLHIDQLLFSETSGARATTSPGRMGPPAAACFALAGMALWLLHRARSASLAQLGAVCVGLMALLALTGYAYGAETLYGIARFTAIALHTAIALLALSVGLIASSVDRGFASIMVGDGAGSLMARRLLALAIAVPLLLGWLRIALQNANYIDTRFGIAALILSIIVIIAALIVRTAIIMNRVEQQKLDADAKLRYRLQEIETMMEVLPVGVLVAMDQSGAHIRGNRTARAFFGLPAAEGGQSIASVIDWLPGRCRFFRDGIELQTHELPVCCAARDGVAVHDLELEVVFADGILKHVLFTALPLLDENQNPRGAITSMMDITAHKCAEKEREDLLVREQQARGVAEAANRAKDQFLASISHELRTPLSAILGWTSILRARVSVDEATKRKALETIDRNCNVQAQLIEDLLDCSRIDAYNVRLEVDSVDLIGVVNAAVDTVRPIAETRQIALSLTLEEAAISVQGDARRLQQVFCNLLANALKFNAKGGSVEIRITASTSFAEVVVFDDGEGILPDFLPYVFDRFRQGGDARANGHEGLGLGLSIARSLVELHGGTIEAKSPGVGHGASFTVRLPLLPAADLVAPAAAAL